MSGVPGIGSLPVIYEGTYFVIQTLENMQNPKLYAVMVNYEDKNQVLKEMDILSISESSRST